MSLYDTLEMAPPDAILGIQTAFAKDTRSTKVNLGIGAYKEESGNPEVLSAVREAEKRLYEQHPYHEYPPIEGEHPFLKVAMELLYGKEHTHLISAVQTIGGSGALRIGAEFLSKHFTDHATLSSPSWPNHKPLLGNGGIKNLTTYPYYDPTTHTLTFDAMCDTLKKLPLRTIVILQASCHNPSGVDPSKEQWKELSTLMLEKKLIPFFDIAYQGFGDNPESDAFAVRYFAEQGHEMCVAQSFSKNFGLYGERVGTLSLISHDTNTASVITSQLKKTIRGCYSVPPLFGERIVTTILQDPILEQQWLDELGTMRTRIQTMRKTLLEGLNAKTCDDSFSFMKKQKGMFSFCGLTEMEVLRLESEFGVYMPKTGRVNIAGLNTKNINYVIDAITAVKGS